MKKVISFSLFGGNIPKYTIGGIHNAKLANIYYPDWICRFYYDDTIPQNIIDILLSLDCEMINKPRSSDALGMMWRFQAMFDESIDIFIVRDADARLTLREKLAVDEWLKTEKEFHVMRDHPHHAHTEWAIFGGMWGGRTQYTKKYKQQYDAWMTKSRFRFGDDQHFLQNVIWNDARCSMVCHDTYRNGPHLTGQELYFPMELKGNYHVGAIVDANDSWNNVY